MEGSDLAQIASGYQWIMEGIEIDINCIEDWDWRADIVNCLKNPSQYASGRLMYKVLKYTLVGDDLYYRAMDRLLLKCLGPKKAKAAMHEVH